MDAALVDIIGGIGTLLILAFFFRKVWHPKGSPRRAEAGMPIGTLLRAWSPFLLALGAHWLFLVGVAFPFTFGVVSYFTGRAAARRLLNRSAAAA